MKFVFVFALFASLFGVIAFGVFGIYLNMQDHSGDCALAASRGADCPRQLGFLDYVVFHMNALKDAATATVVDGASLLLLAVFLMLGVSASIVVSGAIKKLSIAYHRVHEERVSTPPQHAIFRWLSLQEYSPSIVL